MTKQIVFVEDLGTAAYKPVWDYQELILRENVELKRRLRNSIDENGGQLPEIIASTNNHLIFVEHPPVYTLGKSGHEEHILIDDATREQKGIEYFRINRGGDITFHGPGQLVGYPILDLENFRTDIGWYLRSLEEVIIKTIAVFGIRGERSPGETGVWIDAGIKGRERKICAMGVRCSRWITMHGFALNVNTDLSYFGLIIPCGIRDKQVTSMQQELGGKLPLEDVKAALANSFAEVFDVSLRTAGGNYQSFLQSFSLGLETTGSKNLLG